MASNLRVDQILPSTSTNVAIGTATGSVTLVGSVSGTSITNSGVTTVAAGSASAPSITPTGDSNTGIFFPSADTIAFAEGGVEAARFDSSGRLGIGTINPAEQLELFAGSERLMIGANSPSTYSRIAARNTANSGYRGLQIDGSDLLINSNTSGNILACTGGGNLGIGTDNPGAGIKLHVVGGEIKAGRVDASQEGGQVSFGRATDNATGWYIDVYGNTSTPSLRFVDVSNSAVRATIDGSGRFTLPYQPFVAGGSASGAISGNNNHVWATSGYVWSNIGNHWNASTGRFTAPVDGVYQVTAAIRYSSVSVTPSYVYIYFLASYQSASGQPILLWSPGTESGGTYRPRILTAAMYMRANDYVEPRLYVSGGTITIDGGGTSQSDCFLNIYLLG